LHLLQSLTHALIRALIKELGGKLTLAGKEELEKSIFSEEQIVAKTGSRLSKSM